MLIDIIFVNVVISLISLVGVLFFYKNNFLNNKTNYLVSFAAGVMLSTAFISILPEALEKGDVHIVLQFALGGMVFGFFLERFLLWYHHHHEDLHNMKPTIWLILIGDGIHNFVDGLAIAATFLVNPALGLSTAVAIASHEIPQEFADFSILLHCGLEKKKALLYNFISALAAVLGGVVGFFLLKQFEGLIPYTVAVAAGIFIYVSSADLIPELHRSHKKGELASQVLPFIIGIFLMFFLNNFLGGSH